MSARTRPLEGKGERFGFQDVVGFEGTQANGFLSLGLSVGSRRLVSPGPGSVDTAQRRAEIYQVN